MEAQLSNPSHREELGEKHKAEHYRQNGRYPKKQGCTNEMKNGSNENHPSDEAQQ